MDTTLSSAAAIGAAPAPDVPPATGGLVERLLRGRAGLVTDLAAGRRLAATARAMLITIVAGAALFGAAIGISRGGVQIAYAAIKLPLVLVFTAAICAPAMTAFNLALDRPGRLRNDLALVLSALALGALVLAALAPLVLVARAIRADYHQTTLLVTGCCMVSGLASLVFLVRALGQQHRHGAIAAAGLLCAVVAVVGAQAAWTMRPYLVRPRATEVPFVRDVEGSLFEAVTDSFDSAQGRYRRDQAPLPGEEDVR